MSVPYKQSPWDHLMQEVFFFIGVNMQEVLFLYLREVFMQLLQLYLS